VPWLSCGPGSMPGVQEEFLAWVGAWGSPPPPVELLRSEGSAAVLAFARRCDGGRVAVVALAPVEGSSFFAEGLEEPPLEVEDWLTDVNSYMSERPALGLAGALTALLRRAPPSLRLLLDDAHMEEEEEEEEEDDDHAMVIATVEAAEDRARQRSAYSEDQKWDSMVSSSASQGSRQASQVLMQEMRRLLTLQGDGSAKALEIEMVGDSLYHWCVKMHADGFPEDSSLRGELLSFAARHPSGTAAVIMDVAFPDSYPMAPPFIRVVRPRFQAHTGHITVGGSVCMQLLTPSGWLPSVSLENVFVSIRSEMIEGGGRVDFSNCQSDYSMAEAKEAFSRVAARYGWAAQ